MPCYKHKVEIGCKRNEIASQNYKPPVSLMSYIHTKPVLEKKEERREFPRLQSGMQER